QNPGPIRESAFIVYRVPPEQEPSLLQGRQKRLPGALPSGLKDVIRHPVQKSPAKRLLRKPPFPVDSLLPGGADDVRRRGQQLRCLHKSSSVHELVERLLKLEAGLGAHDASKLLDRKSTRLNSSHVKISYAVFCLKKKRV